MNADLLARFHTLRTADPMVRARDAAQSLGVPEGVLVEARARAGEVQALALRRAEFQALFVGLEAAGPVMTLTRNRVAVHETHGPIANSAFHGPMGQVTGAIDLRLFLQHWHAGYHVEEAVRSGTRAAFQVFDRAGQAVIKIYAGEATDRGVWNALVARFAAAQRAEYAPAQAPVPDRPDGEIDVAALRTGWRHLGHTHDFFGLLSRLNVGRQQALRLGGDLASPLDPARIAGLLDAARTAAIPMMCFVGNPGCIQIHSGAYATVTPMGPWLNVLDPDFNLHLRQDLVATAWVVRKPTAQNGRITSVELFDAGGTLVCQFFGVREEAGAERPDWRALAEAQVAEGVA